MIVQKGDSGKGASSAGSLYPTSKTSLGASRGQWWPVPRPAGHGNQSGIETHPLTARHPIMPATPRRLPRRPLNQQIWPRASLSVSLRRQ